MKKKYVKNFLYLFQRFIHATLETFRTSNFDEDFARVGIATYGYLDNAGVFNFPTLKPVMSLWVSKLSSRTLKKRSKCWIWRNIYSNRRYDCFNL